jgi:hypothetical protein
MSVVDEDVLIAATLDAARVLDDYLGSLMGVAQGDVGPSTARHRFGRLRRVLFTQQRDLVRGFAHGYARDQLRKASIAASDLAAAIGDLEAAPPGAARNLGVELRALGMTALPELLDRDDITITSPELAGACKRLGSALAAIGRTRTARMLERMRAQPPGDCAD